LYCPKTNRISPKPHNRTGAAILPLPDELLVPDDEPLPVEVPVPVELAVPLLDVLGVPVADAVDPVGVVQATNEQRDRLLEGGELR
jgi:hypothetical protein